MVAGGSAANAAGRRIAVNVSLVPDCFSGIRVSADWTANPDQVYISFELTDLTTGGHVESLGQPIGSSSETNAEWTVSNTATSISTLDRFVATVTIEDNALNRLLRGQARVRLNCTIANP
jgi:hypothetical protein